MPDVGPGAVIFAQSLQPYVSHGVQQIAAETFDVAACEGLGWRVVRRPLPGSAEFCDVNQLLVQWVGPGGAGSAAAPFIAAVVSALHELGVAAEYPHLPCKWGKCDVSGQFVTHGARLGTLAAGRLGAAFVLLGCLYLSYDPQNLARVSREEQLPETTSLWAEASRPLAPDMLQGLLIEQLALQIGRPIERDTPRLAETRAARRIEHELLGIELAEFLSGEAGPAEH